MAGNVQFLFCLTNEGFARHLPVRETNHSNGRLRSRLYETCAYEVFFADEAFPAIAKCVFGALISGDLRSFEAIINSFSVPSGLCAAMIS